MTVQLSLILPRRRQAVGEARRFTTTVLDELGAAAEHIEAIALALSEACTNAVEHADGHDTFTLSIGCDADSVRVSVTSPGVFEPTSHALEMPDVTSLRGRGIPLMRKLMDEFEVRSSGDSTTVSMCRLLRFPRGGLLVA